MVLIDFLQEVKTGFSHFVVTSTSDGAFGKENFQAGRYFDLGDDLFNNVDDEEMLEEYLQDQGLPEEWWYREIVEIDPLVDMGQLRRFADQAFSNDKVWFEPVINICVYGDDDFEDSKALFTEEWPFEERWPYSTITKEQYDALVEIFDNTDWNIFTWAVSNILTNGLNWASRITDDDIKMMIERDRQETEKLAQQNAERTDGVEVMRGDAGIDVEIMRTASKIASHLHTGIELYAFIRLFQPLNETMTL